MSKNNSPSNKSTATEILDSIYEIKVKFKPRKFKFDQKQHDLLNLVEEDRNKVIFVSGAAGSSKTYLAVYSALLDMQKTPLDNRKDILYVRSVIESASKSMGALPGTLEDKFSPFLIPLEEKLNEMLYRQDVTRLKNEKAIDAIPVNFLRGSSWNDKFIIVDEAQNLDKSELVTLLTRIGENSKLIICGDPSQSDIGLKSGFQPMFDLFDTELSREKGIQTFKFGDSNIYRSEIVKFIVKTLKNG
tara:strand:- start:1027 stop:1761 length:735 start_codon:yes stop_codon:yes gene_type:complete